MFLRYAVLLVALLALPSPSVADTVYSYVGGDFSVVEAPYTTSDFVTLTFTEPAPLFNIGGNVFPTPSSFSFSDGVQTLNNANTFESRFLINTAPDGIPDLWAMYAIGFDRVSFIETSEGFYPNDAAGNDVGFGEN